MRDILEDVKDIKDAFDKAEKDGLIEMRFVERVNDNLWFFTNEKKGSGICGDVVYGDLILEEEVEAMWDTVASPIRPIGTEDFAHMERVIINEIARKIGVHRG